MHPSFSVETRNVHLWLFIDEFNPFRSFLTPYSCWLVILTVYNLPPRICIRPKFMFLSTVIPGVVTQFWIPRAKGYGVYPSWVEGRSFVQACWEINKSREKRKCFSNPVSIVFCSLYPFSFLLKLSKFLG